MILRKLLELLSSGSSGSDAGKDDGRNVGNSANVGDVARAELLKAGGEDCSGVGNAYDGSIEITHLAEGMPTFSIDGGKQG